MNRSGALVAVVVLLLAMRLRPKLISPRSLRLTNRRALHRREARPTSEQWAVLLDSMAAEVRTGRSLGAAVAAALQRHQPCGAVITSRATIASVHSARATRDTDEAVVVQAILAAHALGGPVAATLDAASSMLRERAAIHAEALAHSAQARLSARVLTAVPLVFAAWSATSSHTFRTALLGPVGLFAAGAGGVCNAAGWWWMRRIVGRATR